MEVSKYLGDPCGTKGISQIGPGSGGDCSNLIADSGIEAQSHLPLGHVIRHIPLVPGIHIFGPGESPIDYPPKALQPKEGSHLRLPFLIIAPVKNGNVGGN